MTHPAIPDPDEVFEKLTEERDALRSAVEMAGQQINLAQETVQLAEARAAEMQSLAGKRRLEIDKLREKITSLELENRRMRQLVVSARSRPSGEPPASKPELDPFSLEDPEPEYSS
jgi:chromosome segregation ATPase